MVAYFFYNVLFWVFKFPARFLFYLFFGKDFWNEYRIVDPEYCKKEEATFGAGLGMEFFLFLLIIGQFTMHLHMKYFYVVLAVFVLIIAALIYNVLKKRRIFTDEKKKEIHRSFEKTTLEKQQTPENQNSSQTIA